MNKSLRILNVVIPAAIAGSATLALCIGLPHSQIGSLSQEYSEDSGIFSDIRPAGVTGEAAAGLSVFVSEGCFQCHTQFVRDAASGDLARGWGVRRTVANDYCVDRGFPIGVLRLGPDLSNFGAAAGRLAPAPHSSRESDRRHVGMRAFFSHLIDPRKKSPSSTMPSYRHLFSEPTSAAVTGGLLGAEDDSAVVVDGLRFVPSREARLLGSYVFSLDRSYGIAGLKGAPAAK